MAVSGGFVYEYTGLIKYLETDDELAGVMGNEMAHADRRHSVNQIVEAYGVQLLIDIVLGENQAALMELAEGMASLKNSAGVPEFLNTYPNPDNRVEAIYSCKENLGCEGTLKQAEYKSVLNSLP